MASSGSFLNLTLPDVGTTLGPTWATTLNDAFIDLDDHDHSTQGKSIPSSGLNINADVEFNGNSATELKYAVFETQGTASTTARSLYANSDSDLVWRTSTTTVQLTENGVAVAGFSMGPITSSTSTTLNMSASNTNTCFIMTATGARTINLPSVTDLTTGRFFLFKDGAGTAGTNAVTIDPSGTQVIDGGTAGGAITISTNYGHAWLWSDGTKWHRLQN